MKDFNKQVLRIVTDRLFIMLTFIILLFGIIIVRVYDLQIIHHSQYDSSIRETIQREIEVDAPRGLIFDRYGRPLAVNKPRYILNIDQGVRMSDKELNDMILRLIELFRENGDEYVDEVPITEDSPFEYKYSESAKKQFVNSLPFKNDEEKEKAHSYTADEMIEHLKSKDMFEISSDISDKDARAIIAIRYELYKSSWSKYKLITVSDNVSMETVSTVEERNSEFKGVVTDVKSIRYYPEGEIFGHILGYTRKITASQFEQMEKQGYEKEDIVGQMGIEQTQESHLRGVKGSEIVEVDNRGRKVRTVKKEDEKQGKNVYLTIDSKFQKKTYDIVEKQLTNIILERLKGGTRELAPISGKEMVYSIVESNSLSFSKMEKAEEGTKQFSIQKILEDEINNLDELQKENITKKKLLLQWLEEGDSSKVTERDIVVMLHEQGLLKLDDETVNNFKSNRVGSVQSILIQQIERGHLKPKHMAVDPFSAAAVVVDVRNGKVLSQIGYPTYDVNNLITDFNEYYPLLADNSDKRRLLIDRSMRTAKAPGSTFKMITGIAALEEGIVTPGFKVYDTGLYTKAGTPHARCWVYHRGQRGHGDTDITRALEVSCNYYFYDAAFRLGEGTNTPFNNINILTQYVELFGLSKTTGIELLEAEPVVSSPQTVVEKELSRALWNISNMDDTKKETYIEALVQRISKGYIPWADPSDTSLEGRVAIEIQHELKRNLESHLGNVLEPILKALSNEIVVSLKNTIDDNRDRLIHDITNNVMNDPSTNMSLRNKTRKHISSELESSLKSVIIPIVKQTIEPILDDQIVDSYRHAYSVTYSRLQRNSADQELVDALRYNMNNVEKVVKNSSDDIVDSIADRMISNVVDQILERSNLDWSDGITIRTAIGQGNSAFTPVQVANYITAIANREYLYDLSIINAVQESGANSEVIENEAKIRHPLNVSKSTMDVIHEGMLRVTTGSEGTATAVYRDSDIKVAGKTGTAQIGITADGKHEHSWFVGFAPFDDPQIAIVTTIYNADGAGRYGTIMSKEIIEAYFELNEEYEKVTMDNIFIK